MSDLELLKRDLVSVSHLFYQRGWSLATSSNFSARVDADRILITASGKDKGTMTDKDVILVDRKGRVLAPQDGKPSAETILHCRLYACNLMYEGEGSSRASMPARDRVRVYLAGNGR